MKTDFIISDLCGKDAILSSKEANILLKHILTIQAIRLELNQPIKVYKDASTWADGVIAWVCGPAYTEDMYYLLKQSKYTNVKWDIKHKYVRCSFN